MNFDMNRNRADFTPGTKVIFNGGPVSMGGVDFYYGSNLLEDGKVYTVESSSPSILKNPAIFYVSLEEVRGRHVAARFALVTAYQIKIESLEAQLRRCGEEADDLQHHLNDRNDKIAGLQQELKDARKSAETSLRARLAQELAQAGLYEASCLVSAPLLAAQNDTLASIVRENGTNKIAAIKAWREVVGLSVKEAKEAVVAEWERQGISR